MVTISLIPINGGSGNDAMAAVSEGKLMGLAKDHHLPARLFAMVKGASGPALLMDYDVNTLKGVRYAASMTMPIRGQRILELTLSQPERPLSQEEKDVIWNLKDSVWN
ncbi:MAG: hypothetical protein HQL37_15905 [Alphaproteobacteria bacterium]|nr:hypothetical protein [Alphaproteobacteria bacterium]